MAGVEQLAEFDELSALQLAQHDAHVLAHRELFAADFVVLHQLGTRQNVAPRTLQVHGVHIGEARRQGLFHKHLGAQKIAPEVGQLIDVLGSQFHLLVLEQAAHQLGSRVFGFFALGHTLGRQEHARLDFNQHGRHQQVLGGELQVLCADLVDITQVLARDRGHGDVEDVEVLLANQVEQQVQWAFKRLEKHLQRIRRDVQVPRHGEQRLTVKPRHRDVIDHRGQQRVQAFRGQGEFGRLGAHASQGPDQALVW